MSTGSVARAAVRTALVSLLPTGWTMYDDPADAPDLPCVVILPRSPYRTSMTGHHDVMALTLTAMVPRGVGQKAMDDLDDVYDVIVPRPTSTAIWAVEVLTYSGAVIGMGTTANGRDVISMSIDIDLAVPNDT